MKIEYVKIKNWRSIIELEFYFHDINILIGQNNHGKSNILSALLYFFGHIRHNVLDFNNKSESINIEVIFSDLNEDDKRKFKKYLTTDGKIKVLKQGLSDGSFEYHGYLEVPDAEWLREENISNYTKREEARELPLYDKLPASGRITKDAFQAAQLAYIEEHREDITFNYTLETTNFLGLKSVAQGIFGEVYYIPAVKNANDELAVKGNATFGQLYSRVISKLAQENRKYGEVKDGIIALINLLNKKKENGLINRKRPRDITLLESQIAEEMKAWKTIIEIEVDPPEMDDIIKSGTKVWVDDGIRTDINRKGHGLQRALIFALMKSWSKIIKEDHLSAERESGLRSASDSIYFILEEPELYLHPQAQKELYESLKSISKSEAQIVLSTHSSFFIDLKYYKSIVIVNKKDISTGTKILQYTEDLFTATEEQKSFNMAYWINPDRGELFFAKKVILVEGQTEKTLIPFLAKKLGVYKHEYTLIDCATKDNIPSYINLLNKFKINYTAVYDKDHQSYKSREGKTSADNSSKRIEDKVDNAIGNTVKMINDIEEEIGIRDRSRKNKPYAALNHISRDSYTVTNKLKNKIKKIYK